MCGNLRRINVNGSSMNRRFRPSWGESSATQTMSSTDGAYYAFFSQSGKEQFFIKNNPEQSFLSEKFV